ncbi:MAG TPA: RluA family pseudouridine synthase [Candidatus Limnocylindria bacterium]|jgi:23S rRNA pseudouridine955/2504/2580 synthase/23S rRNA pseudouridine1911/1915/1917 synthase|nr:RluA family pseudouridine synthase [Candidatus Limnocylindria bacterium]
MVETNDRSRALPVLKLSASATKEYWEVPILHEDEHLLAIAKPACLLTSPDRYDPRRPNLIRMLLDGVAQQVPWAVQHGLQYIANAHRLDFETTGVLLLAKDRPTLVSLADQFGNAKPAKTYLALVTGNPAEENFTVDLNLGPDPRQPGVMRWTKSGKPSLTHFTVRERFSGISLIECRPVTGRTHQIRVHLSAVGHPIFGDETYGGRRLFLSRLKPGYRSKSGLAERSLTPSLSLHAWKLELIHPTTGVPVCIEAPWPKDLTVVLKYLRQYAAFA